MKLFLSTGITIAAFSCASFAQSFAPHRANIFNRNRPAVVNAILAAQADRAADDASSKPTAMVQRMVAEVVYQQNGIASDSFRYSYVGPTRGAAHHPKNPSTYFAFDYSPFGDYAATVGYGESRSQYIQMDSATRYDVSGGGNPPVMLLRNFYNSANKLTTMEHLENGPPTIDRRFIVNYNAAGDPAQCLYYEFNQSNVLALNATQTTVFNAQHKAVDDSIFNHAFGNVPEIRTLYTYNAAGALTQYVALTWNSGAWQNSSRTTLTYNSAGLLQTWMNEDYINNSWQPDYKDSFVYAGANPSYTANYGFGWDVSNNSWTPQARTFLHLNAAGNWDTVTTQYYDDQAMAWGNLDRVTLTYNSYNNWETYTDAYDDDNNGVIDPATEVYGYTRYYYELWDNVASVAGIPSNASFTVYPNPASSQVSVRWSGSQKPVAYSLTDIHGRTVITNVISSSAHHFELNMDGCAPGLYLLTLTDEAGAILHREKVVRQ